jgi:hypothetical protein
MALAIGSMGATHAAGAAAPGGEVAKSAPAAAPAPTLSGLEFMSGCWRSGEGGRYFEEIYTSPTANLMLGLSVFVRDGRAEQHELIQVAVEGEKVVMTPFPGGERSPHGFVLTTLRHGEAVFEAPEHDYPKRILYRKNADGSRSARIDGGPEDREGQEWRFVAAACPGASSP